MVYSIVCIDAALQHDTAMHRAGHVTSPHLQDCDTCLTLHSAHTMCNCVCVRICLGVAKTGQQNLQLDSNTTLYKSLSATLNAKNT